MHSKDLYQRVKDMIQVYTIVVQTSVVVADYMNTGPTLVYGQCRANKGPCCNLGLLTGTNILQRLMQISRCPSDPAVTNLGFFILAYIQDRKKVPHHRGD